MRFGRRHAATLHSLMLLTTGLWPVFSLKTFEAVTGPKVDGWLVKTVGLLLASVGTGLAVGAARGRISDEAALIGVLSSSALTGVSVRYARSRRISRVYYADAALHAGCVGAWILAEVLSRRGRTSRPRYLA